MTATAIPQNLLAEFEAFVAGDGAVERHGLFERCRAEAPIFRSPTMNAWVVSRYEDVLAVLRDEERFSTLREGPGAPPYGNSVLQWRGREHQRKGGVIAGALRSPARLEWLDAYVRDLAAELAAALPYDGTPVDLKRGYSMWIPLKVTAAIMGVEAVEGFRSWYQDIAAGSVNSMGHPERRERAFEALRELGEFLTPLIERRRRDPGDDLLSDLCRVAYDGEPLPFEQIRATAAFLLTAGVETTERALSSLLRYVFAEPTEWERLRVKPELVTSAVAETLRVYPPVHGATRIALTDAEVAGQAVAEGDRFLLLLASANRDVAVFDDPHVFRMDRWAHDAARQFTPAGSILPFGAGRHYCMGSQLARIEMVRGMEELLARVRVATFAAGEPPQDEGFLLRSPGALEVILEAG
jgi:pulcherriminic acid synthase